MLRLPPALQLALILTTGSVGSVVAQDAPTAGINAFNPNYFVIGADSVESNDSEGSGDCDLKFQLSFARQLSLPRGMQSGTIGSFLGTRSPFFLGFTQRAWWDICRGSAPFRETNYEPSLFYYAPVSIGERLLGLHAGYLHQSNGRDGARSVGWDRLFVRAQWPTETVSDQASAPWFGDLTLWAPIAISDTIDDITDYAGYGELIVGYRGSAGRRYRATLRKGGGIERWERGLVEIDIQFPIRGTDVDALVQYSNGYGTSLERSERHEYALRIGVIFSETQAPAR